MKSRRIEVPPARPVANANVLRQYRIQEARWISHPGADTATDQFHQFELDFELAADATFILHVSGDQRFELGCDGDYIGMGPDRSDLRNWSFHSYELSLDKGPHRLLVEVHYLVMHRPHAQVSLRPACIVAGEGAPVNLDTGTAEWKVRARSGVSCGKPGFSDKWYQVVGPEFTIDGEAYFAPGAPVDPVLVPETNVQGGRVGFIRDGWRLHPSRLSEQLRRPLDKFGRIRMVGSGAIDRMRESAESETAAWQALVSGGKELCLKAGTTQTVLWDLEEYHCGYPVAVTRGGRGASIRIEWAESCYEDGQFEEKGNRDCIEGKLFQGYGDIFISRGGDRDGFRPFWWRSGRYLRITVRVAEEDLRIAALKIEESRYPLENEGEFTSDDEDLNSIAPIALRGIQMCAHETYMDCPYYEQMMYVGDARLQLLTSCVIASDSRLSQRSMELLDWSRHVSDFVLMRHPSDPRQLSATFSMVWIQMIRDLAWWRRNPDFIRTLLPGMRALLEQFRALADDQMLFTALPGWSFIDWVSSEGWRFACAPASEFGTCGICNLQFLLALQSAREVEEAYGEPHFAASCNEWAEKMAASIREVFWDDEREAFADDPEHRHFSEHAQCLALLSDAYEGEIKDPCFRTLIGPNDFARASIYFAFYQLEAYYRHGRGDLIVEKMDFWKGLVGKGFKAPVEQPEPSRSDCHAWGSHPLFHMHASLCGIRPDASGFETVRIAPQPGGLQHLRCRTPHPNGTIEFKMNCFVDRWEVAIVLPERLRGILEFGGETIPIEGSQKLDLRCRKARPRVGS